MVEKRLDGFSNFQANCFLSRVNSSDFGIFMISAGERNRYAIGIDIPVSDLRDHTDGE